MHKKRFLTAGFSLVLLAGCAQHESLTSHDSSENRSFTGRSTPFVFASRSSKQSARNDDVWFLVESGLSFSADVDDGRVGRYIDWYADNDRYFERTLTRARNYLPYIAAQIQENGLPIELALLPFIESAYNPFAYSHSHASGLWQFIPDTGRHMGLRQDRWYEGRRDIIDSTAAAIRYLQTLNKQFEGDWLLTLAAYNGGPGTVQRAIEANKKKDLPTDFWHLTLSDETRAYVPKLIALSKVLANPDKYDIERPPILRNSGFTVVSLDKPLDLSQAAKLADLPPEAIYHLNPGFTRLMIPANGPNRILLPKEKADRFVQQLASTPASQWLPATEYVVKSGDYLGKIASRFNVSVAELKAYNHLPSPLLKVGQVLQITGAGSVLTLNSANQNRQAYVVKAGDNLWGIAKQYNTTVGDLLAFNSLPQKTTLKPGQQLLIPANTTKNQAVNYQVKHGDSLYDIARQFNVKVNDLLAWNNLDASQIITPGQQLKVHPRH